VVGEVVAHLLYEYDYSRGRTEEMPNFISTLPSSFNYAAGVKHPSMPGELDGQINDCSVGCRAR
jgi:hypothetical protein